MSALSTRSRKASRTFDNMTTIRIAGLVPCDPRTVKAYFNGGPTKHLTREAIRRALQALGLADPRGA